MYGNMDEYYGDLIDNVRHGTGEMKFAASGDRYTGEWRNDLFDGFGTYTWNTSVSINDKNEQILVVGRRYEGDWKNGKRHGKGIYFVGNGDLYSGEFANGHYHGKGTLKMTNEDVYTGEWSRGLPHGEVVMTYAKADEKYEGDMEVVSDESV